MSTFVPGHVLPVSLTPGLAARLIEITRAVDALPEGALALRSPALAAPNAADRVRALKARAESLVKERATMDERFAPAMRPPTAELRQIAADKERSRQFLLRTAMIASQRRAASLELAGA